MKTPTIDLRLVHLAGGRASDARRIADAQRRIAASSPRASLAAERNKQRRESQRQAAEAYKRRVDEWHQRCLDLKSEAWKNGTPDQVNLPERPRLI